MKHLLLLSAILVLTGCSHNIVSYGDGIAFETTLRPDSGNFGIVLRYGKILSVAARENFEATMTGEGKGTNGDNAAGASASGAVTIKVGPQITGYYVKAIEAGATTKELEEYLEKK